MLRRDPRWVGWILNRRPPADELPGDRARCRRTTPLTLLSTTMRVSPASDRIRCTRPADRTGPRSLDTRRLAVGSAVTCVGINRSAVTVLKPEVRSEDEGRNGQGYKRQESRSDAEPGLLCPARWCVGSQHLSLVLRHPEVTAAASTHHDNGILSTHPLSAHYVDLGPSGRLSTRVSRVVNRVL